MPTKIVYVGPFADGVEIGATGQWVRPGEDVEVDSDLADSLLEQKANWSRPTTKAAKAAQKGSD